MFKNKKVITYQSYIESDKNATEKDPPLIKIP